MGTQAKSFYRIESHACVCVLLKLYVLISKQLASCNQKDAFLFARAHKKGWICPFNIMKMQIIHIHSHKLNKINGSKRETKSQFTF